MKDYRIEKTSMGHKIRVKMTAEEIAEQSLFRMALVLVPFLAAAGMFLLWVKMG